MPVMRSAPLSVKVERRTQPLAISTFSHNPRGRGFRQQPRQFRVVEAIAADRLGDLVVDAALEQ
jgi:hypothetical protein